MSCSTAAAACQAGVQVIPQMHEMVLMLMWQMAGAAMCKELPAAAAAAAAAHSTPPAPECVQQCTQQQQRAQEGRPQHCMQLALVAEASAACALRDDVLHGC
jgi:hypothetical protein